MDDTHRTLLVEDDTSTRLVYETALRQRGHEVSSFANAEQAWEACQHQDFDLAVLDWFLPGMDGLELCRRIRNLSWGQLTVILVVTGNQQQNTLQQTFEAGADDYLTKPISIGLFGLRMTIAETRMKGRIERQRSEKARRKAKEELGAFHTAINASQIGMTITDLEGRIQYTNAAEAKMHGYEIEEMIGSEARTLAPAELTHPLSRDELLRMGRRRRESTNKHKDGSTFPVHLLSDLVTDRNGEPIAIVTTCENITKRKETEEALRRAQEIIVRSPAVAFIWKNAEGWPAEYTSDNVARLFGWTSEDFVSGAVAYSKVIYPEDLARVAKEVAQSSADPNIDTFTHPPYRIVTRDGEVKWVEDMTFIVRGDDGNVVSYEGILLDITRRINAEEALQQAHDELELRVEKRTTELKKVSAFSEEILSNMTEGVAIFNAEGRFTFANPASATMLGYQTPDQLIGQSWTATVPPDQIPIGQLANRRRARGESDRYELTFSRRDGTRVPCQISGSPRFEKEVFSGTLSVFTDISARRRAEEALRTTEENYKSLYKMIRLMADNMPDMLWAKDLEGCYRFANLALCQDLLGAKNADDPIGKNDLFFAKRERGNRPNNPHWHDFGEMCNNSDKVVLQCRKAQRFDEFGNVRGKYLFLDVFKAPMWDEDGALIGTVGCARDVTKEKEIERKYRQGEAERTLLSTAINQANDAVVITDVESKILYVNPAFEIMTGYKSQQAIGQTPAILKSGQHDDVFYQELWETLHAGEVWRGHFVNQRADGTHYEEDAAIYPVTDEFGKTTNFVSLKRDVTEEVTLQKRSQHARKMEALGELAGGIAHDFNNLLAITQGTLDLLRISDIADERVNRAMVVIDRATRSATQLSRSLLGFSRQQILTLQPLNFNEFITGVIPLLRRLLPDNIFVDFNPGEDLQWIDGDYALLEQVLFNLCSNSAHAMPEGGWITIETTNVIIDESIVQAQPWTQLTTHVKLSLIDEGVGMDENTQEKVLNPFFTTKKEGEGTGLGLTSAYGTIKQHQGWIDIQSELGVGTAILIYFPVIDAPASTTHHAEPAALKPHRGGETLLVVEDLDDLRLVLTALLESEDYRVQAAADGVEALEILRREAGVAMVITDVNMPRMGGAELYHRSREILPELRFIFCSGNLREWEQLGCSDDAWVSYMEKPFDLDLLAMRVREILDRN